MTYFGILLLCFQACLFQDAFSLCLDVKAPFRNIVTPVLGVSAPSVRVPRPLGYRGWTGRPCGGFGNWAGYGGRSDYAKCVPVVGPFIGTGTGKVFVDGDMPVGGNTGIGGQVPIVGAVQFGGTASAAGKITIKGTCTCGGVRNASNMY